MLPAHWVSERACHGIAAAGRSAVKIPNANVSRPRNPCLVWMDPQAVRGKGPGRLPTPPQLLPWKGVETLLETDSPGGFRLIEATALTSQTRTLHPVARPHSRVTSAVNGPWDRQQTVSQLACLPVPLALGSSLY